MVLSTVVPISLVAIDSFDKTRFRFIAGGCSLSLQETELGGGNGLPFHLITSHDVYEFFVEKIVERG